MKGFEGRRVASLSKAEIMQVQRTVGMTGSKVDGLDTPLTRSRIEAFEKRHNLGHYDKNHSHLPVLR